MQTEEPLSLLIRRKGGSALDINDLTFNADIIPTLISYEMSQRGLGPKLYGVFNGGSVEEYVDSHTLTSEESADPKISKDIALSMAAVHAIKGLPLMMDTNEAMIERLRSWIPFIPKFRDYLRNNHEIKKYNLDLNFLCNFNFAKETDFLEEQYKTLPMRRNFVLDDMHFANCLVRNEPKEGELRVLLIDYDLGHFGFRGIDLGAHFFNRRFDYESTENKIIPGTEFPSDEEKRRFLRIYQQEIKRLNVWRDFDETGIDSIDNLLLESLIGILQFTLYYASHSLSKPGAIIDVDPCYVLTLDFWLRQFLVTKEEVLKIRRERNLLINQLTAIKIN